jgi:hypothetical protein
MFIKGFFIHNSLGSPSWVMKKIIKKHLKNSKIKINKIIYLKLAYLKKDYYLFLIMSKLVHVKIHLALEFLNNMIHS